MTSINQSMPITVSISTPISEEPPNITSSSNVCKIETLASVSSQFSEIQEGSKEGTGLISCSLKRKRPPKIETLASVSSEFSENQEGSKEGTGLIYCSLKRKRPPKIEIPNVLREISSRPDANLAQENAVCFSGFGVGLYSVKGKKKFMEDAHKIVSFSHSKQGFFGVYDGHGGSMAAEFVTENLHTNIFEMLENCSPNVAKEAAIKKAYLKTDQDFLEKGLSSGACCVTALLKEKEIIVSNVGDCRAVLCRDGLAEVLTKDHRAAQEDEKRRIEDKGGYVEVHRGAWRVHGVLSVSRSIGDAHLKDWVVAEPDTRILCLKPDMEFLLLASDGLWEEVGNQAAVDIVQKSWLNEKKEEAPGDNAKENGDMMDRMSRSPMSKSRRVSLFKQRNRMVHSPSYKNIGDAWIGGSEDNFGCENESPPSKARKVSSINQKKLKTEFQNQENCEHEKVSASGKLVAACKELVDLAVTRGSLDDITVMIIDLKCFNS